MMIYRLILSMLLVIHSLQSYGQSVALVLSGGGAKGIAHAGVIQALEENNIPIDFVVGTSMGSVVGGHYAAGYSAQEISDLALSQDMQDWVNGTIEEKYSVSYQMKYPDPSWFSIKLKLDSILNPTLDINLDSDYNLNIQLSEQFAAATKKSKGDFDLLFVPFRSVGANIFQERVEVLDSGSLFEAVRASMSVPFIYRPVRIDGKLIFDGGIFDNFPVDIAQKEFKPDVIIGVNVGDKVSERYPYGQDEKLMTESVIFMLLDKSDPSLLSNNDVFIDVDLTRYSATAFDMADSIYQIGYQSTLNQMEEIKSKIKRRSTPENLIKSRNEFRYEKENIRFDAITVSGFNSKQSNYIKKSFNSKKTLDYHQIKKGYFSLISDDFFVNLFPSYEFQDRNIFKLSGSQNSKLKSKIGGSITSRHISYFFLEMNLKRLTGILQEYAVQAYLGRFYSSFGARANFNINSQSTWSIQPSVLFNKWDYLSASDYLLLTEQVSPLRRKDFNTSLNMNRKLNRSYSAGLIYSYFRNEDELHSSLNPLSTSFETFQLNGHKGEVYLFHNSLNDVEFPTQGSRLHARAGYYMGGSKLNFKSDTISDIKNKPNWWKLHLRYDKYWSLSKNLQSGTTVESCFTSIPFIASTMATEINLPAYYPIQDSRTLFLKDWRARSFVALGGVLSYSFSKNLKVRMEGHAFQAIQILNETEGFNLNRFSPKYALSTGLILDTIIGPASAHLNYYEDPLYHWGVLIKIGHLQFNHHSLD
ncbi:patatin-like phospholipase family protein [Reichenbachiella ulvae]|uniref:Patatin-like phospholipase family protein n=1 Tax=Reichenbachiella ulvae TaxID=2980104 RepID=A0ABT3CXB4_9BACT|nr:patatin-like phospholipase family protein [Reichenbachiella ulvae]MCV9388341.1 patatin-like phospholipase family protein [Reichenbachiella ulvae]